MAQAEDAATEAQRAAPCSPLTNEETGAQGDEPVTPRSRTVAAAEAGGGQPHLPPPKSGHAGLAKGRLREPQPRAGLVVTPTEAALLSEHIAV